MNFMTITSPQHCLICYLEVPPLKLEGGDEECGGGGGLVSKDLHTIFLLRNLFEVPQERLVDYLSNSNGDSPSKWEVRLCPRCQAAVENAKRVYQEMLRVTRMFKTAKGEIVGILRESEMIRRRSSDNRMYFSPWTVGKRILEETRIFACDHEYEHLTDNPFKEGDWIAESIYSARLAAQHLRESQAQSARKMKSKDKYNINTFSISMLHLCKDATGERYQCPLCCQVFSHLSKMKFHAIRLHLDSLFESARFPEVTPERFQSCCKVLMENVSPGSVTSTCVSTLVNSCSHCGKGFTDKRYLHCHWVQHHYEILSAKLQVLQRNPSARQSIELPSTSTSKPATVTSDVGGGLKGPSQQDKPIFTCSQCPINFQDIGEMKVHIAVRHTEQYFPPSVFNVGNTVSTEKFKSCCALLFRGEKYKVVGNESFGCPFCEKTYTSKRFVYLHMLDTHYDLMAAKLKKMVELIPSSGYGGPLSILTAESKTIQSLPLLGPASKRNKKGGYIGRTSAVQCSDCGSRFPNQSVLITHKTFNCPRRRSSGLTIESGNVAGGSGCQDSTAVVDTSFMDYSQENLDDDLIEVTPEQMVICKINVDDDDDSVIILDDDDEDNNEVMEEIANAPVVADVDDPLAM